MENKPVLWRWQYVLSLFLTITLGLLGVYVGFVKKEQGRLDFALDSVTVIASLGDKEQSKLKLFYNDEEIKEASVVRIYIANSGNVDLHLLDKKNQGAIENPQFRILFKEGTRILENQIVPLNPEEGISLTRISEPKQNTISYLIDLMNVKSAVYIDLIVAGGIPTGFERELMGLNLHSRDVHPIAHGIKAPWWHVAISVCISFGWPVLLFKKQINKIFHKLADTDRLLFVFGGVFTLTLTLILTWSVSFFVIARLYDKIRLQL